MDEQEKAFVIASTQVRIEKEKEEEKKAKKKARKKGRWWYGIYYDWYTVAG